LVQGFMLAKHMETGEETAGSSAGEEKK
jgi:hypothetical protein